MIDPDPSDYNKLSYALSSEMRSAVSLRVLTVLLVVNLVQELIRLLAVIIKSTIFVEDWKAKKVTTALLFVQHVT